MDDLVFGHESVTKRVEEVRSRGGGERVREESVEAIGHMSRDWFEMIDVEETAS
jgi:uncharacterized FAD-dependent dehydrogenase